MSSRFNTFPLHIVVSPTLAVLCLPMAVLLFSKAVCAQKAPSPTHLTATVGTGSVTLTWDDIPLGPPPPGGSRFSGYYNIYRATTRGVAGTTPYTRAGSRSDRGAGCVSFTDTHVSPGKTYYYQVTSVTVTTVTFPNFPTKTHTYESVRSVAVNGTLRATDQTIFYKGAILNIKNGQTLSGDVVIPLRVTNRATQYGSIKLLVDHLYAGTGFEANSSPSGITGTTVPLSTDMFSNGWHLLTVNILGQQSDNYRVRFSNDISGIDVSSMTQPQCHIQASVSDGKPWTVTIKSTTTPSSVIRTYHGHEPKIRIDWPGTDNHGEIVPDDAYVIELRTTGATHVRVTNKLSIP